MINHIFNLHSYLIINVAIALSYVFVRVMFAFPLLNVKLAAAQKLRFSRFCFTSTIALFLVMPFITTLFPAHYSNFEIQPILHHVSTSFFKHHQNIATEFATVKTLSFTFSWLPVLISLWIVGFLIVNFNYFKILFSLKKIRKNAFCRHQIKNIYILFSTTITTPFCWSFFNKHFIAVPVTLLDKPKEMRLAIRHELQHIRQGDTHWLHSLTVLKLFCFWNPFLQAWMNWLNDLQEFSCDEAIITEKKTSMIAYAQCLINAARRSAKMSLLHNNVLSMQGASSSILFRRVNMLFNYKTPKRKLTLIAAYALTCCTITTAAYAINGTTSTPITMQEMTAIIKKSDTDKHLQIAATPEVVTEINRIRSSETARKNMQTRLNNMREYQAYIQGQLQKNAMPRDLLALPLIESGYQPLEANKNPYHAAGIWQFIPSTASKFNLIVTQQRDDRLDTKLSTQAAIHYLSLLHAQFKDWRLAVMAYEIGEKETARLIDVIGSRDPWVIARSAKVPERYRDALKNYLAMFDAAVIILHNPSLVN